MAQPIPNKENSKYVLESKDLGIYYGDFRAVTSVNIPIRRHMITAIIGPSGCGKSTLLRAFSRMNELFTGTRIEGEVLFEGENLYDPSVDP
ncbi:MAG TPA: ATP-binding cassette domain-containing protein, partial [Anaerolineales bacterium]|nr:ATP-binding cassette domain-containing protein [Anaerolineales bacterium]